METVSGQGSPITNNDFTPAQIMVIAQLIAKARSEDRSFVDYKDYRALNQPNTYDPSANAGSSSPLYQVQTTLGRFNFERMQSGSDRVTDTYNFNPIYGNTRAQSQLSLKATIAYMFGFRAGDFGYKAITGTDQPSFTISGDNLRSTGYEMLRAYGEAYGPREDEGQGRPVELFVRPVK